VPELNPVEAIWHYLKYVELTHVCCHTGDERWYELRTAAARLRHKVEVIKGCSRQPGCYE
jgi:hypothetical protein